MLLGYFKDIEAYTIVFLRIDQHNIAGTVYGPYAEYWEIQIFSLTKFELSLSFLSFY